MRHADELLAQMNLTVSGAIERASLVMRLDLQLFYSGRAYVKRDMQPTRMKTVILECWKVKVKQKYQLMKFCQA